MILMTYLISSCFYSNKRWDTSDLKSKVGDQYNVPTLAVHTEDEINNYDFPSDWGVIKPTHSSLRRIMRKNGSKVDLKEIRSWLKHNYYYGTREGNDRYLTPKNNNRAFSCLMVYW